jgi:hypothetical protein
VTQAVKEKAVTATWEKAVPAMATVERNQANGEADAKIVSSKVRDAVINDDPGDQRALRGHLRLPQDRHQGYWRK